MAQKVGQPDGVIPKIRSGLAPLIKSKNPTLNSKKTAVPKGQIILKELFGVLEFSQKTNERICRSSKNEFVRSFFGRMQGSPFEII